MNSCSNCKKDYDVDLFPSEDGRLRFCISCRVGYAKNRSGFAFMTANEVFIKDYHPKTNGRIFIIKDIFIYESCESGRMVYLVDKETGRPLRAMIDANWLEFIDQNNNQNQKQ